MTLCFVFFLAACFVQIAVVVTAEPSVCASVCVCMREYAGYHFHLVRARRKQMKAKQTKLLHAPCQVEATTTTATHKLICLYTYTHKQLYICICICISVCVYLIHCISQTISIPGHLDGATFWGDSQSSLCILARFFCSAASTSLFSGPFQRTAWETGPHLSTSSPLSN